MPQERNHFRIGMAAGVICFLAFCVLAMAQDSGGLPASDRRSAIERWAPAPTDVILSERLRSMPRGIQTVYLGGAGQQGRSGIVDDQLELKLDEPNAMMALLPGTPVGGPFVAEVGFDRDDAAALVLVREKDGQPDRNNYTSICVTTAADGLVTLSVHDRQNGQADVLDWRLAPPGAATQSSTTQPSGQVAGPPMDAGYRARFSRALDGQDSAAVKKSSGKLRIFRDLVSGMIRFYCEIRPEILGETCTGWLEVQPSPEWDNYKGMYYVGPAVRTSAAPATVRFHDLRIFRTLRTDRDDRTTGFKVVRRDYGFSGTCAEALVVSLGRMFPFRDADRKLVFWSAASYVPFWHLDDQLALAYGSIAISGDGEGREGKEGRADACSGPMSDRLLRFSRVSVIRDNDVRKRIAWNYVLLNPKYEPWGQKQGAKMLPEVEEVWTVYPDGLILREQRYYPAMDGSARPQSNKVAELTPVVGTRSRPSDLIAEEAISVTGLSGKQTRLEWPGRGPIPSDLAARESAAVVTARFGAADVPDAFLAYAQDPRLSAAAPLELSRGLEGWWGLGNTPLSGRPSEDPSSPPGQIGLGGLIGLGAMRSADWSQDVLADPEGRKYRRWMTLLGLEKKDDTAASARRVAFWLAGASVTDPRGCRYSGYDPLTLEHRIWVDPGRGDCSFVMKPKAGTQVAVRPLIRVEGWGERVPEVRVTGIPLRAGEDMEAAVEAGELIIWINREFKGPTKITLVGN